MNRRDAIRALVSMPAVERIARAEITPTAVLIVECDRPLSTEATDYIRATLNQVFPGVKCLVLGDGLKLRVVE